MESKSSSWVVTATLLILASAITIGLWPLIEFDEYDEMTCESGPYGTRRDLDLYVRGQIHYLSMDYGMGSCWNNTLKRFLHLTCPAAMSEEAGTLTTELAVLLTSCFCETQGSQPPFCSKRDVGQTDRSYIESLVQCASDICFNHHGEDAFESIVSRMPDLCYYYNEELLDGNPEITMVQLMDLTDLEEMKNYVSGEGEERNHFKNLENLVLRQMQEHKKGFKAGVQEFINEIWHSVDNMKYELGIGKYADSESYM